MNYWDNIVNDINQTSEEDNDFGNSNFIYTLGRYYREKHCLSVLVVQVLNFWNCTQNFQRLLQQNWSL